MAENPYEAPQAQLNAPATDSGDEFASRWKRLWGALLDTLIVSLVNVPLMIASGYMGKAMEQTVSVLEIALFGVAAYVVFMLINGYSLHARGQTLGKMIVGTQIASAETRDRLPLTPGCADALLAHARRFDHPSLRPDPMADRHAVHLSS